MPHISMFYANIYIMFYAQKFKDEILTWVGLHSSFIDGVSIFLSVSINTASIDSNRNRNFQAF